MTPEEQARVNIDKLLEQSVWLVQDYKHLNLGASLGIAVREFPIFHQFIMKVQQTIKE